MKSFSQREKGNESEETCTVVLKKRQETNPAKRMGSAWGQWKHRCAALQTVPVTLQSISVRSITDTCAKIVLNGAHEVERRHKVQMVFMNGRLLINKEAPRVRGLRESTMLTVGGQYSDSLRTRLRNEDMSSIHVKGRLWTHLGLPHNYLFLPLCQRLLGVRPRNQRTSETELTLFMMRPAGREQIKRIDDKIRYSN